MLARWESEKLYEQVQAVSRGRKLYWFVDGPPYANGDIHLGHAVNKTLKDMVVKAARLDGHDAAFVPGWDCHGLPIELQVEKKFGKVGEKLDAAAFRAKCREYALEQVDRQRQDFKRLGVLADWDTALPDHAAGLRGRAAAGAGAHCRERACGARLQAGALVPGLRLLAGRGRGGVSGQAVAGDRCALHRGRCGGAVASALGLPTRCRRAW